MRIYSDRADAAARLADAMPAMAPGEAVVLALPRGGVPLAAVMARRLGAPLDLLLVRKVGAPGNPELAIGAVTGAGAGELGVNDSVCRMLGLGHDDVAARAVPEIAELERRRARYLGSRPPVPLKGRTAIVVDDGVATGTTARAALRAARARGAARVILAVPVAAQDTIEELRGEADEIVCPEVPDWLPAVGAAYASFPQVEDAEVLDWLREAGAAP